MIDIDYFVSSRKMLGNKRWLIARLRWKGFVSIGRGGSGFHFGSLGGEVRYVNDRLGIPVIWGGKI